MGSNEKETQVGSYFRDLRDLIKSCGLIRALGETQGTGVVLLLIVGP